jgi:hypothetical protein
MKNYSFTSKISAFFLTALITASAALLLTGCNNGGTGATAGSESATTASITEKQDNTPSSAQDPIPNSAQENTQAAEEHDSTETPADSSAAESDEDGFIDKSDEDKYIDESEAIANVKKQAGSGAQIINSEKGYSPDGFPAWIIVVAPVTASDEPVTDTYYSGYQFCYKETAE